MAQKTHREVKKPTVSARFLADYMAASEAAKRSIIGGCKFQPVARLLQHDEARAAVGRYIRSGGSDVAPLRDKAAELRARMADDDFDRSVLDVNADYIARFADVAGELDLPDADIEAAGRIATFELGDVKVNLQPILRLRRRTRTNKVVVGLGALRYAKGKPLREEVGFWQSSLMHGYLREIAPDDEGSPDNKLCITIDAYAGTYFQAPTDAVRRFKNITAACSSIAERWPNIPPPKNAVL